LASWLIRSSIASASSASEPSSPSVWTQATDPDAEEVPDSLTNLPWPAEFSYETSDTEEIQALVSLIGKGKCEIQGWFVTQIANRHSSAEFGFKVPVPAYGGFLTILHGLIGKDHYKKLTKRAKHTLPLKYRHASDKVKEFAKLLTYYESRENGHSGEKDHLPHTLF
jgi:hypothetical protein